MTFVRNNRYLSLLTVHRYSQSRTLQMTDCPHEHEPDTGLQTFKDIVREEFDQASDSIRRNRPHRGVRRLQRLVRLQPFQPRKRPSLLRLHLGHLQNQNGKKQRPQAVQGHPTCRRKNVSGRGQRVKGRSRAGMISRKRPASQSWTESVLALGRARRAQRACFLKNFFAPRASDSPKVIQTNSTPASH